MKILVILFLITTSSFGAVNFDSSGDALIVQTDSTVNDITTLSISVWVYIVSEGPEGSGRILDKHNNNANGGFILYVTTTSIIFYYDRWNNTAGMWSIPRPSLNTWHHIAISYDANSTANNPIMYIDGVPRVKAILQNPTGFLVTDSSILLTIGNRSDIDMTFDGLIDEVAIWNVLLFQIDITKLFESKTRRMAMQIRSLNLRMYFPLDEALDDLFTTGDELIDMSWHGLELAASGGVRGDSGRILSYQ